MLIAGVVLLARAALALDLDLIEGTDVPTVDAVSIRG
jgi:hypothetical protein